jgi:hypothetical protein
MNTREQGLYYRINTLRLLAKLGYASTRQIAKAVWWQCTPSTRKMATRTLKWLRECSYIVSKRDEDSVNGEMLSAVSASGARWLAANDELLPLSKTHGRDWLRHAHSHRTACNSTYVAIVGLFPDSHAWSEIEIRASEAPINEYTYWIDGHAQNKIPDVIAEVNAGFEWVEVENNWRCEKDLHKVISCMRAMFRTPSNIATMHFVITAPGAKKIGQRLRHAMTHSDDFAVPRQIKELDARILKSHIKVSILDVESMTLKSVKF